VTSKHDGIIKLQISCITEIIYMARACWWWFCRYDAC